MLKGISQYTSEHSISRLLKDYGDVQIRLISDRGHAYVDFETLDLAQAFVEGNLEDFEIDGKRVTLDYAMRDERPQDWVCDHCESINFARRHECYHCSRSRPERPRFVPAVGLSGSGAEPDVPVIMVKGLSEEAAEGEILVRHCATASLLWGSPDI